jgi:hypothetical protein
MKGITIKKVHAVVGLGDMTGYNHSTAEFKTDDNAVKKNVGKSSARGKRPVSLANREGNKTG